MSGHFAGLPALEPCTIVCEPAGAKESLCSGCLLAFVPFIPDLEKDPISSGEHRRWGTLLLVSHLSRPQAQR